MFIPIPIFVPIEKHDGVLEDRRWYIVKQTMLVIIGIGLLFMLTWGIDIVMNEAKGLSVSSASYKEELKGKLRHVLAELG